MNGMAKAFFQGTMDFCNSRNLTGNGSFAGRGSTREFQITSHFKTLGNPAFSLSVMVL